MAKKKKKKRDDVFPTRHTDLADRLLAILDDISKRNEPDSR